VAAFAAFAIAGPLLAQTGTPVDPATIGPYDRMQKAVFARAFENLASFEGLLPPQDQLRLNFVAQQRVVADTCAGFEMDDEKFRSVMEDILSQLRELTEEGQENLPVDIVMGNYMFTVGGLTAMAAYDPARFCERGAVLREELAEDTDGKVNVLSAAP
jgi:hypothetical protein